MNVLELAQKHGIRLKSVQKRAQKVLCPQCSHKRTNKDDPCLSVRIDESGLGWRCHHCGWTGGEFADAFKNTSEMVRGSKDRSKPRNPYGMLLSKARSGWVNHAG